jgi:hypothetical protein
MERFLFLGKGGYSFGCRDAPVGPIRDKDVGFVRNFAIAIGSPDETFAVGSKHGKAIQIRIEGDAFPAGATGTTNSSNRSSMMRPFPNILGMREESLSLERLVSCKSFFPSYVLHIEVSIQERMLPLMGGAT